MTTLGWWILAGCPRGEGSDTEEPPQEAPAILADGWAGTKPWWEPTQPETDEPPDWDAVDWLTPDEITDRVHLDGEFAGALVRVGASGAELWSYFAASGGDDPSALYRIEGRTPVVSQVEDSPAYYMYATMDIDMDGSEEFALSKPSVLLSSQMGDPPMVNQDDGVGVVVGLPGLGGADFAGSFDIDGAPVIGWLADSVLLFDDPRAPTLDADTDPYAVWEEFDDGVSMFTTQGVVSLGDVDGDGLDDAAVAYNRGPFTAKVECGPWYQPYNQMSGEVAVVTDVALPGTRTLEGSPTVFADYPWQAVPYAAGDVDGDGLADLGIGGSLWYGPIDGTHCPDEAPFWVNIGDSGTAWDSYSNAPGAVVRDGEEVLGAVVVGLDDLVMESEERPLFLFDAPLTGAHEAIDAAFFIDGVSKDLAVLPGPYGMEELVLRADGDLLFVMWP